MPADSTRPVNSTRRRPSGSPVHSVALVRCARARAGSATRGGTAPRSASTSTPTTILEEITDDLLYHGDLNAALRRMHAAGFRDRNGERLQGMRELSSSCAAGARDELERYDLGGVYDDIAQELREVVDMERAGLDELARRGAGVGRPAPPGDHRRRSSPERNLQLDMLPPDLAGRCRELQEYEFTSTEARERFEELMDKLAPAADAELLQPDVRAPCRTSAPRTMQRMKDMLAELNELLEQRERGRGHAAGLRAVHGALRRLLPREPRRPSTSCSS